MKKIALATLLASGLMAADSGLYLGLDYGKATNTHEFTIGSSSAEYDNDYSDLKFKIGGGTDGELKFQGYLSKINYDIGVYDNQNNALYEIGFDIIKEFEVTPSFYPFVKGSFGVGRMDTDFTADGYVSELTFNIGAGLSYKAIDHIYILAGVDYIWRRWSDLTNGSITLETSDTALKPYIGMNYKF
ncbi:MAG: hypothetical protein Q7T91_09795 [Sulfuricurvum sp.]|nr:hypothetical protein [Sulfuricurvum sp.]